MPSQSYAWSWVLLVLSLLGPSPTVPPTFFKRGVGLLLASGALVNITIDDISSLITYSPPASWRSSSTGCSTCLAPSKELAFAGTWHDGTHLAVEAGDDADDRSQSGKGPGDDDDDDDGDDASSETSGKGRSNGDDDTHRDRSDVDEDYYDTTPRRDDYSQRKRGVQGKLGAQWLRRQSERVNRPIFTPRVDADDGPSADKPVTAEFNFTGSAIYVFAILPQFSAPTNTTPSCVNLTYTLDQQPAGAFTYAVDSPNPSYSPSSVVFQRTGLLDTPHSLTVSVGPGSVLLLDYIVYSQENSDDSIGDSSSTQPIVTGTVKNSPSSAPSQSMPSSSSSPSSSKHNVATFAGAVGGSVGLLSVLALSLAFSIYRRRSRARRRDRAYREARRDAASITESYHTDASEDAPPMHGPAPFVPRYFPGTLVVTAPPPYSPPTSPTGGATTALLGPPEAPIPSIAWSSRRTGGFASDTDSYAEHPPPTPPPGGLGVGYIGADVEEGYFAPPPSFAIAITTPVPAILAGLSGVSSPAPAASPSLDSRPTTPASPIIPLLAPPPSSRPVPLSRPSEQGPDAGTSGTQPLSSPRAQAPPSSSQASVRSLQIHVADEPRVADADANSIRHSLPDSNRAPTSAPALIPPITPAAQFTRSQELNGRNEGDRTSTHL